jgi:hypothetical protein
MTEKAYCYHCRTYHDRQEVRRVLTRIGYRWRCIRSLAASRSAEGERDAFGRAQTAENQAAAQRRGRLLGDHVPVTTAEGEVDPFAN